jgi:hypothetical protein
MMSRSSAEVAALLIQNVERAEQFDDLMLSCPDKISLIAEGEYDAIVLSSRKQRRFRRDLLAFTFRIVTQCAAFGVVLPGYCNLDFGPGRGRQLPARSKLVIWLRRIQAFAPEISPKKVHLAIFGQFQFVVRVATSRGLDEQHPLPTDEHYSQITEILGVTGRITGRGTGR